MEFLMKSQHLNKCYLIDLAVEEVDNRCYVSLWVYLLKINVQSNQANGAKLPIQIGGCEPVININLLSIT